jgi:hypothetical protein
VVYDLQALIEGGGEWLILEEVESLGRKVSIASLIIISHMYKSFDKATVIQELAQFRTQCYDLQSS